MLIATLVLSPLLAAPCAPCHPTQTTAFAKSGMTLALQRASQSPILQLPLAAKLGRYSYQIANGIYTVSDGSQTLRIPLAWAFGQGTTGQTYLYQRESRWYESRVSYYAALKGLDITIGAQSITPRNLEEAAGRLTSLAETVQCFDCHATGVRRATTADLSNITAGVQCERCHGSSESHLRSMAPMKRLSAFSTEQLSDFCGECHRTWSQIASEGPRGIQNIRFQPYRLANSKCYDAEDRRIRCTACHDPHRPLETSTGAYDAKCLACHSRSAKNTAASAHLCKVSENQCSTCHMPSLELPGAHKKFTDHRIRIAKANEPYPD